jgi:predicted RNA-binding protein Jag
MTTATLPASEPTAEPVTAAAPAEPIDRFADRTVGRALAAFDLTATHDVKVRPGPGRTVARVVVTPPAASALSIRRWGQVVTGLQAVADAAAVEAGHPEGSVEVVLPEHASAHAAGAVEDHGLVAAARVAAEQAVARGKAFALGPLSAVERRLVHQALGEVRDVWTQSEGEGIFRRLWVIPRAMMTARPPAPTAPSPAMAPAIVPAPVDADADDSDEPADDAG